MPRRVLGSTTDVPALRAQLEVLAAAGEHVQVIATLFELVDYDRGVGGHTNRSEEHQ